MKEVGETYTSSLLSIKTSETEKAIWEEGIEGCQGKPYLSFLMKKDNSELWIQSCTKEELYTK